MDRKALIPHEEKAAMQVASFIATLFAFVAVAFLVPNPRFETSYTIKGIGLFFLLMSFSIFYVKYCVPLSTPFLLEIASAEWCPEARLKLREITVKRGDKINFRDYGRILAIQERYELIEAKARGNAKNAAEKKRREDALRSIQTRK